MFHRLENLQLSLEQIFKSIAIPYVLDGYHLVGFYVDCLEDLAKVAAACPLQDVIFFHRYYKFINHKFDHVRRCTGNHSVRVCGSFNTIFH